MSQCRRESKQFAFHFRLEQSATDTMRARCGASEQGVQLQTTADFSYHTRRIITSVALIRAAAVCPSFSCISRAEVAVMIDVICCPPIEILTSAIRPLMR